MSRLPIAPIFAAGLVMAVSPAVRSADLMSGVASNTQFAAVISKFTFAVELGAQTGAPKAAAAKPKASKPAATADTSLYGTWRISRGVIAPWVPAKEKKEWNTKEFVGQTLKFDAKHMAGPGSLKCADAHFEATSYPADALFQGGLKEPVKTAAKNLGFSKFPVAGTSLNCDAGLYEFHKVDATTELVAINNVIWTLDRSPGAMAEATTPAGAVQRFLETHFQGNMGFDAASMTAKSKFLTPSLVALSKKYFAKPVPKGDAPDIEGDPFTDSQDYPTRFSVGAATATATSATVPVRLSDTESSKTLTYLMVMDGGVWRVDDVRYDASTTFRNLLSGKFK